MDYLLADWRQAGLRVPTAYRSYFTMCEARDVARIVGHLTARDWAEVQARLRLALAV
jgi:hypothetical protein